MANLGIVAIRGERGSYNVFKPAGQARWFKYGAFPRASLRIWLYAAELLAICPRMNAASMPWKPKPVPRFEFEMEERVSREKHDGSQANDESSRLRNALWLGLTGTFLGYDLPDCW